MNSDRNSDSEIREKLAQLVNNTDQKTKSPEERATMILGFLKYEWPDLTDWDLTCFASQWLGAMAIGPMPWLLEPVKVLSNLVHKQHYLMGGREQHDSPIKSDSSDSDSDGSDSRNSE